MKTIKRIAIVSFITIVLSLAGVGLFAQNPPPPPPDGHGQSSNQPPGGGVPIDGGLLILISLVTARGVWKFAKSKSEN